MNDAARMDAGAARQGAAGPGAARQVVAHVTDVAARLDALIADTAAAGTRTGRNLVAFSGGVDSSLVAFVAHAAFGNAATAVLGVSPSLAPEQEALAVRIAAHIGIRLERVATREGDDATYIANEGMSCYVCKSTLYDTMEAIASEAARTDGDWVLFNGTNADDLVDETRVGLRAAAEHRVLSPLRTLTKSDVRALARHAGLPNWDHAAAPCLRSRLAAGVAAIPAHLARIAEAERLVRARGAVEPQENLRVRHLPDEVAAIEADPPLLARLDADACAADLRALGFRAVVLRPFASGSVAARVNVEE